jgi:hypothetical protein
MKKLIVLLVLMFASSVFALPGTQSWKAVWDANPELDVAGYYLYWRTPGGAFSDTDRIDVGNLQEQVLTGIVPNKTEIAVTCYDTSGNEGGLSTVVPFDTDDQAPASVGGVVVIKE